MIYNHGIHGMSYSDMFTGYTWNVIRGGSISGHNMKKLYNLSLYNCKYECMRDSSCVSFDFSPTICFLSEYRYNDVSSTARGENGPYDLYEKKDFKTSKCR